MKARLFVCLFAGWCALLQAKPLPPAVEKFHKDGIRLTVEKPALIQGEAGGKEAIPPYLVQLHKGQTYQFDLAAAFAASLRVEEHPGGALLLSTAGKKGDFIAPRDGVYRWVVAPTPGATGRYSLTLVHKAPSLFRDPPGVRHVGIEGLNIADAIAAGDQPDKVRRHLCKTYDVRLHAAREYHIDMMSNQLDCYLRIEDPTGKQIAFNDDGGEGLNSRLLLRVPADGVFRVVCTTFGGGQGAFTLTIRQK